MPGAPGPDFGIRDTASPDVRAGNPALSRLSHLGRVGIEVYRVVFTWRGEKLVRIISAQRASKDEEEVYYRETFS